MINMELRNKIYLQWYLCQESSYRMEDLDRFLDENYDSDDDDVLALYQQYWGYPSFKKHFYHDCEDCIFLGNHKDSDEKIYDLYFCNQGNTIPTVIARFGDYGPEYYAGLSKTMNAILLEAKNRAIKIGLIDSDVKDDKNV